MPISMTVFPDEGYYVARFFGQITDDELNDVFLEFHATHDVTGLHVFADLSEADFSLLTSEGISRHAQNVLDVSSDNSDVIVRSAVYAPDNLAFGISRMYLAQADDIPQRVRIFRNRDEAMAWMLSDDSTP